MFYNTIILLYMQFNGEQKYTVSLLLGAELCHLAARDLQLNRDRLTADLAVIGELLFVPRGVIQRDRDRLRAIRALERILPLCLRHADILRHAGGGKGGVCYRGGRVRTNRVACPTHSESSLSVRDPAGETNTSPFRGRPVKSIGRAFGFASAFSYA